MVLFHRVGCLALLISSRCGDEKGRLARLARCFEGEALVLLKHLLLRL